MREHHCPGIDGSNPLYFLASLGILRLLPEGSELAWRYSGTWNPVYRTEVEDLAEVLAMGLRRGVAPHPFVAASRAKDGSERKVEIDQSDREKIVAAYDFVSFSDIPKVDAQKFRRSLEVSLSTKIDMAMIGDACHPVSVLSGINAEGVQGARSASEKKPSKGESRNLIADQEGEGDGGNLLEPTAFSFSNGGGGQFLIKDFLSLVSLVSTEAVRRSLQGEEGRALWFTSLNWNPEGQRSYAHQWSDPESSPKVTDVASNTLAFLGLASLPVMPTTKGNITTGYDSERRSLRWPLWDQPLTLPVIASFLASLPDNAADAATRGAVVLFEARRRSANKRLYFSSAGQL